MMFGRKRKPQPSLEAAVGELVQVGVGLAETLCASFKRETPIGAEEIDRIENFVIATLMDGMRRSLLEGGTPQLTVDVVSPGLEAQFRAAFAPRFRELAPLMTPMGSA